MLAPHSREAAPALAGCGSSKTVLLASGDKKIDGTTHPLVQELHRRRVRLRRLLAKLDALVIWRDDILVRLEHAKQMQDAGVLLAVEQDDLIDAVLAWKLAAAGVVLDLDAADNVRRTT